MTTDERRFAAIDLVERFWQRAWNPPHDLEVIRQLAIPDVALACGGRLVEGVDAVVDWVREFQRPLGELRLEPEESFASADATRVTSRWRIRGVDRGLFGSSATQAPVELSGIAIWAILWDRNTPRLAEGWFERSLWEVVDSQPRLADLRNR